MITFLKGRGILLNFNFMKKTNNKVIEISPDKYFYLVDGKILTNLNDLINALKKMTKETYNYHVSKDKNDFANWIKDVFGNQKLAEEIRKVKTAKGAAAKIK